MSVWLNNESSGDQDYIKGINRWKPIRCLYCNSALERIEIGAGHRRNGGVLRSDGQGVRLERIEQDTDEILLCVFCGWWYREKCNLNFRFDRSVRECVVRVSVGILKSLSLEDVSTPIDEIRSYIMARYEERFNLNPRLFEELVSSVFRSLGYHAETTAYSRDGGIDVILQNGDIEIGVQVKRHRNRIKVSQIRELVGTLFLQRKYHRGMFVTTSDFTRGAKMEALKALKYGMPIELIDAESFFRSLRIAQGASAKETRAATIEVATSSIMQKIEDSSIIVRHSD